MKARKVVTRSGRGFRGYFPSKKLCRLVEFESTLERDAIKLFENERSVISFQEQPTIIYYYLNGLPKRYFPDFELVLVSGQVVHIEVKPLEKLSVPAIAQKYNSIAQHYSLRQEHFVILTEKEIRTQINIDFYQLINNLNLESIKGANHAAIHP